MCSICSCMSSHENLNLTSANLVSYHLVLLAFRWNRNTVYLMNQILSILINFGVLCWIKVKRYTPLLVNIIWVFLVFLFCFVSFSQWSLLIYYRIPGHLNLRGIWIWSLCVADVTFIQNLLIDRTIPPFFRFLNIFLALVYLIIIIWCKVIVNYCYLLCIIRSIPLYLSGGCMRLLHWKRLSLIYLLVSIAIKISLNDWIWLSWDAHIIWLLTLSVSSTLNVSFFFIRIFIIILLTCIILTSTCCYTLSCVLHTLNEFLIIGVLEALGSICIN